MKKILSKALVLSLAVVMAFALAACGNKAKSDPKEDALGKLNSAMEKTNQNTYVDMDITGTMDGSILKGETIKFKMKVKSKSDKAGKFDMKKQQAAMAINMTIKGQTMSGKSYIKDGYTYTNMMNRKAKMKLDKSMGSFMNPTNMSNLSNLNKLDKEYVKEASSDGDKITVDLDYPKFFNSYFADAIKGANKKQVEEALKSIKTFKLVFTVKDDEIKATDVNMEMSVSDQDMKMEMKCKYNKLAKDGKISFPSDLKTYPLMTAPRGASPFGM